MIHDPALLLLGMSSKDSLSCYRDTRSSLLTAALFTMPRTWKQTRRLPIDEQIMQA